MKNTKSSVVALLTFGLAATVAFAQHQGPNPAAMVQKRVQHLTTLLSLTSSQQQQATTIFTNAISGGTNFRGEMKTAHQNLQTAIKNNDQNGIAQAATTIGNMTSQMISAHAKAEAAFYQILTPDQQAKMNELKSEGMGWGPRGHFMH